MNMTDYHSSTFKPVNGLMLIKVDPLDKVSKGGIKLVTQKAEPVDRGTIVATIMAFTVKLERNSLTTNSQWVTELFLITVLRNTSSSVTACM
jgi:hypothetical protein